MRRRPLFAVMPGWVTSRYDGQRHRLAAHQVARAYGLRETEWQFIDPWRIPWRLPVERMIFLGPRSDGQYAVGRAQAVIDHTLQRAVEWDARLTALEKRWPARLQRWNVMTDLETMGTAPGSVLASIGAVAFNQVTGEIGPSFYRVIDQASCEAAGLKKDPATIAWWGRQRPEVRAELEKDPRPLAEVLGDFDAYWKQVAGGEFWANGANFDDPLLAAAYRALGREAPWKFWNARDTRTIYAAAKVAPRRGKGHHVAVVDALDQAKAVIWAYRVLGLNGRRGVVQRVRQAWRYLVRGAL